MAEINPELIQSMEEENKRWLPAFAEVSNKFFNSKDAITIATGGGNSVSSELYRFIVFQTNNFVCRLRATRWGKNSREALGDSVVLEWMQRPSSKDLVEGYSPSWGFITIAHNKSGTSVLAEELPNASEKDIEDWNNGNPVLEIAESRYPIKLDDPFSVSGGMRMNSKDVTKLLLEAQDGKVNKPLTKDISEYYMEEIENSFIVPNEALGINIPVSLSQSIRI